MGKSQRKREEIEEKYTWDLSYIYKKDSDICIRYKIVTITNKQ